MRLEYNSHNHLKCIECGRITDIQINETNNYTENIIDKHDFDVHDIEVTFIGIFLEHKNNK